MEGGKECDKLKVKNDKLKVKERREKRVSLKRTSMTCSLSTTLLKRKINVFKQMEGRK